MFGWKTITFILCNYGFWKELRPTVPFLTPFLVSPYKNFTDVQLYSQIYPFWTYSYMVMLIPIFIITDLLRYKPIILLEASALIATWCLLIWGEIIPLMQTMQIIYGLATAAEVAYYSYIYAAVDNSHFQKVTSFVRSAALAGKCLAYGLGQLLISTGAADYMILNYISLGSLVLTLVLGAALPSLKVEKKKSEVQTPEDPLLDKTIQSSDSRIRAYFRDLISNFVKYYSARFLLKWSLWWALATCGFFQIGNYIQNLWDLMQQGDQGSVYNGVTEAVSTLLGTIIALSVQFVHVNWSLVGELALGVITLIDAVLLVVISQTDSLVIAYIFYVFYCTLYQMLITIATYNVARNLETSSYGLVIGCNTFLALILQAILTFLVADQHGFALEIRKQFLVYSIYHAVIAVIYLIMAVFTIKQAGISTFFHNFWEPEIERQEEERKRSSEFIEVKRDSGLEIEA